MVAVPESVRVRVLACVCVYCPVCLSGVGDSYALFCRESAVSGPDESQKWKRWGEAQ